MDDDVTTAIRTHLAGVDHPAESWLGEKGQVHTVATYLLPRKGHFEVFNGRSGYYVIDTLNDEVIVWKPTLTLAAKYLDEMP